MFRLSRALGVWGSGFRVSRVWGLRFLGFWRFLGLGFRVSRVVGLGLGFRLSGVLGV